jgi:hypothetical protein
VTGPDIRLGITAVDLGASRLVRGIADALRALNSVQAQQARTTSQVAAASRQAAAGLETQARIARAAVTDEQNRLRRVQEASRARIAAIRAEREAEIRAARDIARAQNEVARGFQRQAQERLRQAQTVARIALPSGGFATTAGNPALVAARRRELAEANANVARAAALGRQQIAQARQLGAAQVQAARQTVTAQQQVVRGAQQQAQAALQAARAANQLARANQLAANRAAAAFQRQLTIMNSIRARTDDIRNRILRLAAAYSGFRAIEGFIGAGLRFNQVMESSRLGIGALITAQAELFNQQGELLTGTTALSAAQGLAADQLAKLRVAGIQTAATTEDLVTSFEEAVGAGLAVGLNLDQIRRFTVSIAQAASAIHLPMNQLQQETRSILQGTIDRNSRIAKALQLTNEEIRLAKEQNRLAELLEERFRAFNIAGAESVKTFGALRSNISDAFSVFAGRATEPLFVQLRDAAFQGLSKIFDFRSADIAQSFRGLVSGLQAVFEQIGGMLADSIRLAVDRAEALSEWLAKNRQEIKETAAAIRTMVEDFGRLLGSVISLVGAIGGMARETNAVIGLARILSALFQTLRNNIEEIALLLAGRTLLRGITQLATLATAITTGAGAGALVGPVGAVIGTIISLGVAYKLLKGFQSEAALEAARTTTALEEQRIKAATLLGTIAGLNRQLQEKGISDEQRASVEAQLAAALQEVIDLGPEYKRAIEEGSTVIENRIRKLEELAKMQQMQAAFDVFAAQDEVSRLEALAARPIAPRLDPRTGRMTLHPDDVRQHREATAQIAQQLDVARARVQTLTNSYDALAAATTAALEKPAEVRLRGARTDEQRNKDLNDAVQIAQAELEQIREYNATRMDIAKASLKRGIIDSIEIIELERDQALAELAAEEKLAIARRDLAERRVVKGKSVPDFGGIRAAEIQIEGIEARRVLARQEAEEKILIATQQRADAERRIEEDVLKARGQRVQAVQAEVQRKFQEQLNNAIREFGADSEQVVKIRFVIQQESIREQAEALEDEIRRIEEGRNREIENARFRILGPADSTGQRRRGNAQQQQQIADAIAAANARAAASTAELRGALIDLRDQVTDPIVESFIQSLINDLDALKDRAEEVDLELRRLREGVVESLIGGLSGFFDSLTDKTKTLGDSFREMVNNILGDISRLVSRLLAEKIIFSLFGVTPAAEGGQAGNLTQSQGRATGGLARPPHGELKGGIPGVDSIHIAAMPKEYFVQERAVDYYGAELFDLLNKMQLPRVSPRSFRPMALGGGVGDVAASHARPSQKQEHYHYIDIRKDGFLEVLKGRIGRDATLGHVHGNPRAVSSALRGRR